MSTTKRMRIGPGFNSGPTTATVGGGPGPGGDGSRSGIEMSTPGLTKSMGSDAHAQHMVQNVSNYGHSVSVLLDNK